MLWSEKKCGKSAEKSKIFVDQTGKISYNIHRMASSLTRKSYDSLRLETAVEHNFSGGVHNAAYLSAQEASQIESPWVQKENGNRQRP